jgi:hypothetical protein
MQEFAPRMNDLDRNGGRMKKLRPPRQVVFLEELLRGTAAESASRQKTSLAG